MVHILQCWKPYEDLPEKEALPELQKILEDTKSIISKISHVNAVVYPAKNSKSEHVFNIYESSNFVDVNRWPSMMSCSRRQSQINENDIPPEYTNGINFNTVTPWFYSCDRCLTNQHSYINCKLGSICLQCKQRGHYARQCKYNLCVHCQLYGHSRRNCPNLHKPPRCFRCGGYNHTANRCYTKYPKYCRLCAGRHKMTQCKKFNGECYKHFGAHKYGQCSLNLE
uniref:CCHC-type domain-containing protein n=1 Tax=Panagrolaimus davidi TaxID=227884 RepID=A0A914Q2N2_9BILA